MLFGFLCLPCIIQVVAFSVMVFAVVEKAGTVVMNDGEELDSWSVIINGEVRVDDGINQPLCLSWGDAFGIEPTMEKRFHKGVMRTVQDDCQFVCITQVSKSPENSLGKYLLFIR